MPELPKFENFNQEIADAMLKGSSKAQTGIASYLGINLLEFGPGTLTAELEVVDELITPNGTMHGGVMAAFMDHVLGVVCYPVMDVGKWAATTEFKLNYMAAIRGGTLTAKSEVVSMTRSTIVVRALVENAGRLCCSAQGTLLIREPKVKT